METPSSDGELLKRASRRTRIETVGQLLFWSYANLAAADSVAQRRIGHFDRLCWMIRAKLFKGLREGTMNVGTLFADVRDAPRGRCAYCGAEPPPKLHADHLIPKHRGGLESADNLVWACRSCNSSKGARDLLEWYAEKQGFPAGFLVRRYLKLAMMESRAKGLLNVPLSEDPAVTFAIHYIPTHYPTPDEDVIVQRWTLDEAR